MSEDESLPDELVRFEKALADRPAPATSINRDELMYQSGYAAALAETSRGAVVPSAMLPQGQTSTVSSGVGRTATWSLASAAIAASIAVFVMLQVQTPSPAPTHSAEQIASGEDHQTPTASQESPVVQELAASVNVLRIAEWSDKAPMLAWRDRALRQPWDISATARQVSLHGDPTPAAKTHRDMLEELLPASHKGESTPGSPNGWRLQRLWEPVKGGIEI